MSKYINANDIKSKLRGGWINVYLSLAPQLNNAVNKFGTHVTCPVHGGKHGDAFRLDNKNSDGAAYCNTCGKFLDGIEVLKWVNNWIFRETIERLDDYINGLHINDLSSGYYNNNQTKSINSYSCEPNNSDIEKRRKSVERIIKTASKTPLEPHLLYLKSRGLKPICAPSIKYHAGLPYYYEGHPLVDASGRWRYYPCIVGIFKNSDGVSGITKIYLTNDGKKAESLIRGHIFRQFDKKIENVNIKLSYKIESLSGSAIRVGKIGEHVNLCEGLETGIALINRGLESILIATTATLLSAISLPKHVRSFDIYADNDDAGRRASLRIVDKFVDKLGVIHYPPDGINKTNNKPLDWLDIATVQPIKDDGIVPNSLLQNKKPRQLETDGLKSRS